MVPPPTAIVPLSLVIAECPILSPVKRGAVEVIVNRNIPSTIIGEISAAIACQVVPSTKRGSIAIAIDLNVPCPINRNVSLAIGRQVFACTHLGRIPIAVDLDVSCPINRDISLAIDRSIVSRAKISITRDVLLVRRARPGVLSDHPVWMSLCRHGGPLPGWRGRSMMLRAPHCGVVCRPRRPNIRGSMRGRFFRPCLFLWLTPRRKRQREGSEAY
jgi:hypothetical protein